MTMHARSDVISFSNPKNGHTHSRKVTKQASKNQEAEYEKDFSIKCPECEAHLATAGVDLWSSNKHKIPRTPDEEDQIAREKEEGSVLTQQMAKAMADRLASDIHNRKDEGEDKGRSSKRK